MLDHMKRGWKALTRAQPGSRFQGQYKRQQKEGETHVGRILRIVTGTVIVFVGIFFLPAPGPGFVIIALGGALLAREFKRAAKLLDHLEVRGRQILKWGKQRWQRLVQARRAVSR